MTGAVVTTPRRPPPEDVAAAKAEAERLGLPYLQRRGPLETLGAGLVLLVTARDRALWAPGADKPWRFHGGMAVLRIRRMLQGEGDPLLAACDIRPGDEVLDATGGPCADALVLAHAVGPKGRVRVIETSPLLHAVISHGVKHVRFGEQAIDEALDRLEVLQGEHKEILSTLPDRSVDVVYFDPMFRDPAKAAPGFDLIRLVADPRPLDPEALRQAMRVARRRVVIQDKRGGGELERLGVPESTVLGRWAPVRFGVIELQERERRS